jgi:hypothetical protein
MRPLIASLFLAAAGCGSSSPANQPTPCPADKQFCIIDSDAGCTIVKLACCGGEVPACSGTYNAGNPNACAGLPSQTCP